MNTANPLNNPLWLIRVIAVLAGLSWTAWSGFRPAHGDSRTWYDRTIRAAGGLILLAVLVFGLILVLSEPT